MKPGLLVCAPLAPSLYDRLLEDYRCVDYHQSDNKQELLATEGAAIRAIVQTGETVVTPALLDLLPNLEIISVFGVGYDGVPVDYCRQRGIKVTHTPGVLTDDVADLATGLVVMTSRGLCQMDRFVRDGRWLQQDAPLSRCVTGKTAGILGMGRVGKAIAERLSALKMTIAYTDVQQASSPYRFVADLAELAAQADFLIVACPGGEATRKIVNGAVLEALGPEGILINVARGSIVDEDALVRALEGRMIAGAGLDVFANEPHVPDSLVKMSNVVLLPHVASATRETRQAMAELTKANLDAWFAGEPLPAIVPELR